MIAFTTTSGRCLDLEYPHPEDIDISDIARGLSHCCRFAGQLPHFYSVAQHSVLVSSLVDPPLHMAALLHDGSEAYLGDLSRNLKHSKYLLGYRVLEERLQDAVQQHFGYTVSSEDKDQVKIADDLVACFENVCHRELGVFKIHDLSRLQEAGFVRSSVEDMSVLVPRLKHLWDMSLDSKEAEDAFIAEFNRQS